MSFDSRQVDEIVSTALGIASNEERAAFLESVCGSDEALRAWVEALVKARGVVAELPDQPTLPAGATEPGADEQATLLADDAPARGRDCGETPAEGAEEYSLDFLSPPSKQGALGRLAHYEVLEVLGQGGFGIVLKAFDEKLHRMVAIKVLAPQLAASATARKRFIREAQAAAAVRHEHVIDIHAVDEQPVPYLVMEYVAGPTLQQKLDRSAPLGLKEILRIGYQIASGLAAAHRQGLIHRDIKPANILLENGVERVKITDFGLARAADDASLTQSGMVAGTPMYMAPEQAMGQALDHRADLFSLGTVLYVTCTGRAPFRAGGTLAILKRVCEETPRPVREINPEIPQWLADIIAKLHAKQPDERFQSAKDVADVLAGYLSELQLHGEVGRAGGVGPRVTVAGSTISPKAQGADAPRSPKPVAAMFIVAAMLLALGAVYWAVFGVDLFSKSTQTSNPKPSADEPKFSTSADSRPLLSVAPFNEEEAKAHQEAWANYLGVDVEIENSLRMKMRLVPPGEFAMGSTPEQIQRFFKVLAGENPHWASFVTCEGPQQTVEIKRPYYMGAYEVTVGQFRQFVEATRHQTTAEKSGKGAAHWSVKDNKELQKPEWVWSNMPFAQTDEHPVVGLSWDDAQAFCVWLSEKESVPYVLPTEGQWEFACRAGNQSAWCFGDDDSLLLEYSWNDFKGTGPVRSKKPNAFGLFDMHGNAHEYCLESWIPHRAEPNREPKDVPKADPGSFVVRGGCWITYYHVSRSAYRRPEKREIATSGHGFRVAMIGDLKPSAKKPELPH